MSSSMATNTERYEQATDGAENSPDCHSGLAAATWSRAAPSGSQGFGGSRISRAQNNRFQALAARFPGNSPTSAPGAGGLCRGARADVDASSTLRRWITVEPIRGTGHSQARTQSLSRCCDENSLAGHRRRAGREQSQASGISRPLTGSAGESPPLHERGQRPGQTGGSAECRGLDASDPVISLIRLAAKERSGPRPLSRLEPGRRLFAGKLRKGGAESQGPVCGRQAARGPTPSG